MAQNIIRQEILGNVKMTFKVGVRKVGCIKLVKMIRRLAFCA